MDIWNFMQYFESGLQVLKANVELSNAFRFEIRLLKSIELGL